MLIDKAVEIFNEIWQVELYRGALLAVAVFFAVLLLYWFIKLIIFCKFGNRRCAKITVGREHGNIVVAANAVSAAISSELRVFPELEVRRIALFCKRGKYSVELRTTLVKSENSRGLPELYSLIEPLIKQRMNDIFGITDLDRIIIRVDHSSRFDDDDEYDDMPAISPELPDISPK